MSENASETEQLVFIIEQLLDLGAPLLNILGGRGDVGAGHCAISEKRVGDDIAAVDGAFLGVDGFRKQGAQPMLLLALVHPLDVPQVQARAHPRDLLAV